jgi:hypothetical protein
VRKHGAPIKYGAPFFDSLISSCYSLGLARTNRFAESAVETPLQVLGRQVSGMASFFGRSSKHE